MPAPTSSTPNFESLASDCLDRCGQLALCSESSEQITRRFLTPPMQQVHGSLASWMNQAGMSSRVDHAGNLIGKRPASIASADPAGGQISRTLLMGSHLDTVPNAGRYDGILGVVIGLAVVEALGDRNLPFEIEVIGFSEEEGIRFQTPYIGSRAIAGTFEDRSLDRIDDNGDSMRSAIEAFGLSPDRIPEAGYEPERVIGFVEPHVEQGTVLKTLGHPVGVVDAIAGQTRLLLSFEGEAGHAGTTPMSMRRDALVTAARWIAEVSDYANGLDDLRATVGYVNATPNARNVIPGMVEVSADIRHSDNSIRSAAVQHLCDRAKALAEASGVVFAIKDSQSQSASTMDRELTSCLSSAVNDCEIESIQMVSGAGHDASVMAESFPTAMLFIRQPNGVSHHPDEDVHRSDVAACIEVLTQLVDRLSQQHQSAIGANESSPTNP